VCPKTALTNFIRSRQGLSPRTIQWYKGELSKLLEFCPGVPAEPECIEEFLNLITGSPETKHAYYRAIKAFYQFLYKRYGFKNPMDSILAPYCPKKVMPTLEPEEMLRMLNLADNTRDKALLTVLIDTGSRAGEIANLRKQYVGINTILVNGKTGERQIPISEETRVLLLNLINSDGKHEHVFMGQHGPLTRSGIYRIIRIYMKKAGIKGPKLGPHRIRHAFGKGYLVSGGDLRSLQKLMGHANISTTEKYTALNLKDIVNKHHRYTPLRVAHAASQGSFFDTSAALKEAEAILEETQ